MLLLAAAALVVLPRRPAGRARCGLLEAEMRALTGLQRSGTGYETWQLPYKTRATELAAARE